ncbi:hypothetical protein C8Q79DRAFT_1007165 [Trametes meyenii]|nr:hypothetical protein C8Q79DRAFT_1007165 [Trametes meyenii]
MTERHPLNDFPEGPYLEDFIPQPRSLFPAYYQVGRKEHLAYHIPHINQLRRAVEAADGDSAKKAVMLARQNVIGRIRQELTGVALSLVNATEPLSETEWKAISPTLVAFFEFRRSLRIRQKKRKEISFRLFALQDAILQWSKAASHGGLVPLLSDLSGLASVSRSVVLSLNPYAPLPSFGEMLPDLVQSWKKGRLEELTAILNPLGTNTLTLAEQETIISLPSSLFFCVDCSELVSARGASRHVCCIKFNPLFHDLIDVPGFIRPLPNVDGDLYEHGRILSCGGYTPWSASNLRSCTGVVTTVLQACGVGFISEDVDWRKVDSVRVACLVCSTHPHAALVMGWRRAVHHSFSHHHGTAAWKAVATRVATRARFLERARLGLTTAENEGRARWVCRRCNEWPLSDEERPFCTQDLMIHMDWRHAITHPGPADCYKSSDSPQLMHPEVLVVASECFERSLDEMSPNGELLRTQNRAISVRLPLNESVI